MYANSIFFKVFLTLVKKTSRNAAVCSCQPLTTENVHDGALLVQWEKLFVWSGKM